MSKKILFELEKSEELRLRAVADLAAGMDITFKEAEKIHDMMVKLRKRLDYRQSLKQLWMLNLI